MPEDTKRENQLCGDQERVRDLIVAQLPRCMGITLRVETRHTYFSHHPGLPEEVKGYIETELRRVWERESARGVHVGLEFSATVYRTRAQIAKVRRRAWCRKGLLCMIGPVAILLVLLVVGLVTVHATRGAKLQEGSAAYCLESGRCR